MKTHSWPENHWHWPVKLSHHHGVRRGGLIFTGGQADLNSSGEVVSPDDLAAQTTHVLQYVENILTDFDASFNDLIRLVVYFTGNADDETLILDTIASHFDSDVRPTVSTICLPALCYPGMRIELEAVAIDRAADQHAKPQFIRHDNLPSLHSHFSHVIKFNHWVFTSDMSAISSTGDVSAAGDVIEQTRLMMANLEFALTLAGARMQDVLKLNVFYQGDGTAESWTEPARIRASCFPEPGPAATGIALTGFAQPGLMTKIAVTAGVTDSDSMKPTYSWPDNHWNWTTALPYKHGNRFGQLIHLGGQVALDSEAKVLHPNDIVAQTKIALANIGTVLNDLGADMDDVVKVTTFYQGGASAEALHENLLIRSNAFQTPGPATSGIPVPHLVYERMVIEIEVIAMARNAVPSTERPE